MKQFKNDALIVTVFFSTNNTIINVSNAKYGLNRKTFSTGNFNFKKGNRSSFFAIQVLTEQVITFVSGYNQPILLVCSGINRLKSYLIKQFIRSKLYILRIIDKTKISHNGCRSSKFCK